MGSYQALYRAFRPETFSEVCGQETITRTLKHQIVTGHVAHAYLFCGSRGTGKTSTAKVFARAINCKNSVDGEPCGKCEACEQIKNGTCLDVLEIDAASNNGVDEVRELREGIAYPPTVGRKKVYIIDEVHMLSTGAFNALLKTLEEPPEHAVFILATTEPQKLLATVLSRCQRFDFKRISVNDIVGRMQVVLNSIGRECEPNALEEIAAAAEGGMRDALSLLDMCLSYTSEAVDAELVREVLGSSGREFMFEFTDALEKGDTAQALTMVDSAMRGGRDPAVFARETAAHLRTVLLAQMMDEDALAANAEITHEAAHRFSEQAARFENTRLMRAMDIFMRCEGDLRQVSLPRAVLEMNTVLASRVSDAVSVQGLTERIEALEKQLATGVITVTDAPKPAAAEVKKPASPVVQPADAPAAATPEAEKFYAAVQAMGEAVASSKAMLRTLKFLRYSDGVVYASIKKAFLQLLINKSSVLESQLEQTFGEKVKLNLTQEGLDAQPKANQGAKRIVEVSEIFGRENVELVD